MKCIVVDGFFQHLNSTISCKCMIFQSIYSNAAHPQRRRNEHPEPRELPTQREPFASRSWEKTQIHHQTPQIHHRTPQIHHQTHRFPFKIFSYDFKTKSVKMKHPSRIFATPGFILSYFLTRCARNHPNLSKHPV